MGKQPAVPNVGVIALVYHNWSLHWMTPHHVLTRLAEYFHVVWVNPAHSWREIPKRLIDASSGKKLGNGFVSGFNVYYPEPWLPTLFRPKWLTNFTFEQRLKAARRILARKGCEKIILYLWHYEFADALKAIPYDLSCYHIDDEYSFSDIEVPLDDAEAKVIAEVDHVFAISPGLMKKKGNINPSTTFAPEGVDYQAYADEAPEPNDMASIPRPRIGYTGVLKKQLDWPLLRHLALNHRNWSFVFVGPINKAHGIEADTERLAKLPNVYFLGGKSVQQLASYPQHFDVCMMPYRVNEYTKYIYPLKIHEYFASGRPVVGAPIESLQEFVPAINLASTHEEWSCAIAQALSPSENCIPKSKARQNIARKYDWQNLIRNIARIQCDRLGMEVAFFESELH